MARFDNAVVVVTGGASGIGEATTRALVAEGGRVVIADLQEDRGRALVEELGDAARFHRTDVTREENIEAAVALALNEFGSLTGMVNNAGIVGAIGGNFTDSVIDFLVYQQSCRCIAGLASVKKTLGYIGAERIFDIVVKHEIRGFATKLQCDPFNRIRGIFCDLNTGMGRSGERHHLNIGMPGHRRTDDRTLAIHQAEHPGREAGGVDNFSIDFG